MDSRHFPRKHLQGLVIAWIGSALRKPEGEGARMKSGYLGVWALWKKFEELVSKRKRIFSGREGSVGPKLGRGQVSLGLNSVTEFSDKEVAGSLGEAAL